LSSEKQGVLAKFLRAKKTSKYPCWNKKKKVEEGLG